MLDKDQEIERLKKRIKELNKKIESLDEQLLLNDSTNKDSVSSHQRLEFEEELNKIRRDKESLSKEKEKLSQKYDALKKKHFDITLREKITSELLSSTNENNHKIENFSKKLREDFFAFADNIAGIENSTTAILALQDIERELKMVSAFPDFHSKKTVAVAGGFSAGKSEFISSFFSSGCSKLPRSVTPTTAIPTYVMGNNEYSSSLIGISHNGGKIDLGKLLSHVNKENKLNFSEVLTHDFIGSFKYPLKNIMPYMCLMTKLDKFNNICFVDTPGYNSSSQTDFTQYDKQLAKESIINADEFIWLVGIDVNGTLPNSDVQFLQEYRLLNKIPYIVLNKASLKSENEVREILENIKSVLKRNSIKYYGISVYDSLDKKEYFFVKKSLNDFLTSLDEPSSKQQNIVNSLYKIGRSYRSEINKKVDRLNQYIDKLNKISALMLGDDYNNKDIYDQIEKLMDQYNVEKQKANEHLKKLDKLIKDLKNAIDEIFGEISLSGSLHKDKSKTQKVLDSTSNNLSQTAKIGRKILNNIVDSGMGAIRQKKIKELENELLNRNEPKEKDFTDKIFDLLTSKFKI
ncbi:hypothetical protein A1D22_00220 [Pasteurellaceae bacterium LFhippo2]|nr:hypothetical protein [Pasteurellaceae bacterium LFhippo2]